LGEIVGGESCYYSGQWKWCAVELPGGAEGAHEGYEVQEEVEEVGFVDVAEGFDFWDQYVGFSVLRGVQIYADLLEAFEAGFYWRCWAYLFVDKDTVFLLVWCWE
jgi:hypothetical protein